MFDKIRDGIRTFDLRKDHDFKAGDIIHYREKESDPVTKQLVYTGRELDAFVGCVYHGTRTDDTVEQPKGQNPLLEGYVIVALKVRKASVRNVAHSAREHVALTRKDESVFTPEQMPKL